MEGNSSFDHNIYKNDPLLFKSYIDKEVIVFTENGSKTGIVYTVDPVSESVVLLRNKNCLEIIFGHAIRSIEPLAEKTCELPELFTTAPINIMQSVLEDRKATVIKVLRENRCPVVEENGILRIEDALSINPPYRPEDCISTNSIILTRIQAILSRV